MANTVFAAIAYAKSAATMPVSGGLKSLLLQGRLVCVQIDTGFASHRSQTFLFQGLDGFGRQAQPNKPLTFFPPHALILQVGFLHLLGATVRVRYREGVVALFVGEIAMARHGFDGLRNSPTSLNDDSDLQQLLFWENVRSSSTSRVKSPARSLEIRAVQSSCSRIPAGND